ncbi:unnamed protein product [Didymodactylos carnosus]|uniref:Integrase catalytic domain-containing protein n=1 Tax=Didymodactylos carnosus TaxID=1234261 RepID=A0A815EN25_9BILA|nr:unnamed protein product [Didymodactylos carnosus]CAF4153730.1 unnamed protein product [Didymodactylos carnosus]
MEEVILKYGVPRKIITDQGTHFKNELMEKIALLMGFKHAFATTYHPQTNGQVERFNATFYPQLAKLHDDNLNNWDEYLPACIFAYNTGLHSTTGYSPFQLMFAREPILPFDSPTSTITLTKPNDYWTQITQLTKVYRRIHQQQLSKQRYDQQRADPTYKPGDLVFIKPIWSSLNNLGGGVTSWDLKRDY